MTKSTFHSQWTINDRVHIDNDTSIVGIVTGICFRLVRAPTIEVSWFANGDAKTAWFEEWRLNSVKEK